MASSRPSLRDLFREAFLIYKEMEGNRNLQVVRRSKLNEITRLLNFNEEQLPEELLKEQTKTLADVGKYKNIIDVFSCCSEVILKKKDAEEAQKRIDAIKSTPEQAFLNLFSRAQDDVFDTKFNSLVSKLKTYIQHIDKQQVGSKSLPEVQEKKDDPLKQLIADQQLTIKLLESQNNAFNNSLTRKEAELKNIQQKLIEHQAENKSLAKQLDEQAKNNAQLNNQLSEMKKYYLFNPSTDEQVSEADIKWLINAIIADIILDNRYKAVSELIAVDPHRKDPEAYQLISLKQDIDHFHSTFANIYKEELFENSSTKDQDQKTKESKKQLCEQVAAKAISQILECNSLRLLNSGVKSDSQTKDTMSAKEMEAINKFKVKIDQLEARKKTIAAFYEEILKRIENIEKNKISLLAKKVGQFAKRNYPKLIEQAKKHMADEKKQNAMMGERSLIKSVH